VMIKLMKDERETYEGGTHWEFEMRIVPW